MKNPISLRTFLVAASVLAAPIAHAATTTWDGTTASYTLANTDSFTYTAGFTGASATGLTVSARDLLVTGNLTVQGAFSFVESGGGGLYQGIELVGAASTITATAITLTGDIGKQISAGNSLALDTSAANGAINLNVSFGRVNVWYAPTSLTANAGNGTITISGTNGFGWQGSTAVSLTGGVVNVTGNVNSGAAFNITNSLASTVSSVMSGAMSFTKSGAGTMTLSGSSTFTGALTVSQGTLYLSNGRTLNGAVTVNSGATLTLESNGPGGYYQPNSLTVNNATVNSVVLSSNRYHGIYTPVINFTGTSSVSTPIFVSKAGVTGETLTINVATGGAATISGTINNHPDASGGTLIKTGAGTLTLTGGASANSTTLTGNITVTGGILEVGGVNGGNSNPIATSIGNMTVTGRTITINSGATLKFISYDAIGAYNYVSPVTFIADGGTISTAAFGSIGNVTLQNGAHFTIGNGTGNTNVRSVSFNGTLTVSGTSGSYIDVASGAATNVGFQLIAGGGSTTFNVGSTGDATADLTVTAPISDSVAAGGGALGAASLIKTGTGRMVLAGANSYSGGTTLRAGTIVASNSNALGTSGTVTLNDASTSTSDASLLINATAGSITIARNITVANQGSGTVTLGSATTSGANQAIFSGTITLGKNATLNGGSFGDRLGFTGNITGTANVTIAGTNRVLFTGSAKTYAGTTTINSGSALQLSDGTSTSNSFLADSSDVTVTGALKLAKGGNSETIAGLNGAGTVSAIAGADTLIVGNGNANGSFSGALNNNGATLAFTKTGSGTQTLTGTSNYTGATAVSSGTLALGTGGVLGNTAVTVSSTATFTTAAGTTTGGSVTVATGGTLTTLGTISGAVSIAGTGTISGTASSTLGVTGTATVASGGSVSGISTISSGGLLTNNGTLSAVTLNSGGTLKGSGSVGAVNVAAGTANIIAGNGTSGSLTLASLTFAGNGSLTIGTLANYTSTAAFSVTGALGVSATNVTLALPVGIISNGTYKLLSYGSTAATTANFTMTGPVIGARQFGSFSQDVANSIFLYTVTGDSPIWMGNNSSALSGGSNWKLVIAGTATDYIANDSLLLDDTATGTTIVDISGGNIAPAVLNFNNSTKDYTLQGSNGLSSGSIVKNGTGNLTITNANSASSVVITAGTITLGNAGALGTTAVTLSGGTLDLNNQSTSASIVLGGGAITGAGEVSGVISGGALNKASAGTLTLSGQNTFTGGTNVSNGVLALGHATNTLADAGAVTVSGGELSLGSNSDTVGAVTLTGGSITGTGALTGASYSLQAGTISAKLAGSGAATKTGAGTATLSAANTNYSGAVTVSAGTISVGNDAALGTGTVTLNGGDIALSGQTISNALVFGGGSVSGTGTVSGAISGSSAFTKSGSGTLTLSGNSTLASGISVTGGTLSLTSGNLNSGSYAGNIATSNSGILALSGNSNQTLSGVISGNGSFTKSGNGTLTLSGGASTLTGDITISGGTVTITAASAAAQSTSPTTSGLGNMTVSRTITVDGSTSILEFNAGDAMGAFGYASPVMLVAKNGGVIARASTSGAFNSIGSITLQEGGILRANAGANATVQSLSLNGNVTVLGTTLGGTIEAVAGSNNGIHLRSVGSSGNVTFDVADTAAATDLNVSANLLNPVQVNYLGINAYGTTTGIIKTGAGRMVLAGTNAFTGSTTVSAGTLAITGTNVVGGAYTVAAGATLSVTGTGGIFRGSYSGSSIITLGSGATLELQNWHYGEASAALGGLTANASGIVSNGATIRVVGATATSYGRGATINSGGVTLEAGTGANWTIDTVNDSNAWVYNGNPSITFGGAGTGAFNKVINSGTGTVTKTGAGTWTLAGVNTYSGATTINGGTLVAGNAGAFGSSTITLNSGTLDLGGYAVGNAITYSSGSITNSSAITGSLLINSGTLSFGSSLTAFGSSTITVGTGSTLDLNSWNPTNSINLAGGQLSNNGNWNGTVVLSGSANSTLINTLTLNTVRVVAGSTVDLAGVSKDITFEGGALSNLSTYTGTLTVKTELNLTAASTGGALRLETGGSINYGSRASTDTIQYVGGGLTNASNYTGNLNVVGTGLALTAGNLGAGKVVVGTGTSVSIGAAFSNAIRLNGGSIVGSTLNNYSGTVTVASGQILDLDGASNNLSISNTSADITLETGATLKGNATVGDITVQAGGILAPGNSPGLITASSLTLNGGSSMNFEVAAVLDAFGTTESLLAGTDYDTITVTGLLDLSALSFESRFNINLLSLGATATSAASGWDSNSPVSFVLFTYGTLTLAANESITSIFSINSDDFYDTDGVSVLANQFSVSNVGNQILLNYSVVPEPSTYGIILGGLALAAAAIRRRKQMKA